MINIDILNTKMLEKLNIDVDNKNYPFISESLNLISRLKKELNLDIKLYYGSKYKKYHHNTSFAEFTLEYMTNTNLSIIVKIETWCGKEFPIIKCALLSKEEFSINEVVKNVDILKGKIYYYDNPKIYLDYLSVCELKVLEDIVNDQVVNNINTILDK